MGGVCGLGNKSFIISDLKKKIFQVGWSCEIFELPLNIRKCYNVHWF